MGEIEARRMIWRGAGMTFVDFMNGDPEAGMVVGGTSVIEIAGIGSECHAGEGDESSKIEHLQGLCRLPPIRKLSWI